jgi:hypothetical protein
MMNATTDATKLNFITDQGSTRDSVSIACRLLDRRTLTFGADAVFAALGALGADPPRKADVTEFASPAAAPPMPAAAPAAAPLSPAAAPAAVDEKPPVDAFRLPLAPEEAKPAESALTGAVGSG